MTHITLHSNQSVVVYDGAWTGDFLTLDGTGGDVGVAPLATFTGVNALAYVVDSGAGAAMGHGAIAVDTGATLTTSGMLISSATMTLSERFGANLVLGGVSQVVHGSTLTATLFRGYGTYTVNGVMTIDATSTVNMDYVSITGSGQFHLTGEDALARMGSVGSGNTVVLDGGMLSLANGMDFQGTITDSAPAASRIGAFSSVDVYNAMNAVRETFNETTGILNLFDANGGMVANLKFTGTGDLYAAPTTGMATNYIAITSHPGGLPVTITH
jgi:hypothetical protein